MDIIPDLGSCILAEVFPFPNGIQPPVIIGKDNPLSLVSARVVNIEGEIIDIRKNDLFLPSCDTGSWEEFISVQPRVKVGYASSFGEAQIIHFYSRARSEEHTSELQSRLHLV